LRKALLIAMLCLPFAASLPSQGEEPVVSIGKQRAAAAAIEWDVRDVSHPLMGPIRTAVQRSAVATAVKSGKILSQAFVSCQKSSGKIAIELVNAPESDARSGLGPVDLPRLVCNSPRPQGDGVLVKSDLAASWEIGGLGDTLARGLSPAALRRCASIDVLQNVALPKGWPQESLRIAMEITPYARPLDAVFAACGETTAFAPEATAPVAEVRAAPAPPQVAAMQPPPRSEPAAPPAEIPWKAARAIATGRTNVRRSASIDSAIVVQLDPGARILVQQTSALWWKAKPRSGASFAGYIRRDRVVFE
jgi:hypothetical protein